MLYKVQHLTLKLCKLTTPFWHWPVSHTVLIRHPDVSWWKIKTEPKRFGLFRFRSPLLPESLFTLFSSSYLDVSVQTVPFRYAYEFSIRCSRHDPRRVSPFGYSRIKACWRLPETFRSLPRPSSVVYVKASVLCPWVPFYALTESVVESLTFV